VRNRALILTLWRAGLRIDEALTLAPQDAKLDDEQPVIRVRRAKGDKQRTVGLHAEARDALRRWPEVRRVRGCDERRPARAPQRLFCTLDGGKLDSSYVRHLLRRLARKGAVQRRVHPHAFRATLAVEMCVEGVPLPAIRDVLGHTNLSVTDAYLRRVFPQQAIDAVRNRRSATPPAGPQRRAARAAGPDRARRRREARATARAPSGLAARSLGSCPQGQSRSTRDLSTAEVAGCGQNSVAYGSVGTAVADPGRPLFRFAGQRRSRARRWGVPLSAFPSSSGFRPHQLARGSLLPAQRRASGGRARISDPPPELVCPQRRLEGSQAFRPTASGRERHRDAVGVLVAGRRGGSGQERVVAYRCWGADFTAVISCV
jgi:hypothetical protein